MYLRYILIIVIQLFICAKINAQYKVLYVKGAIKHEKTSKQLNPGDTVSHESHVLIDSEHAVIVLYHPKHGRVLLPKNINQRDLPNHNHRPILRKSDLPFQEEIDKDLQNHRFLVLGDEAIIPLIQSSRDYLDLIQSGKFEVTFKYQKEPINNTITKINNILENGLSNDVVGLKISRSEFYNLRNGSLAKQDQVFDVPIITFTNSLGMEYELGYFSPIFLDDQTELDNEIKEILRRYSDNKYLAIVEIMIHLESNYGKPILSNVIKWLSDRYNIY